MADDPSVRSVKIGVDERTGWSSERPRRDGAPPRPVDVSARCRVLAPTDRMRYSPGSLVLVVSANPAEAVRFAERVVEERGAVLSLAKVRALLAARVGAEQADARAGELLGAAVAKRLSENQTVVVASSAIHPAEREGYVRQAHALRRPRHMILLETPRDQVPEDDRAVLNELRRALDTGELGQEGFQTAMRLGGGAASGLKRIIFQPPPKED